ncbi:hypothetical protein [Rathayibacter sp. SD072]|uniref:hypothetical protein n=1 Tax=Rathayibacter sp. SD072 TaxID=2781731 RepID=UPI001A97245F|nr:hypothetical protein [Rathayibacter sp. SD072]MBO0982682.1 hypothetical protein [Rathayibacter sp. SD072]
MSDDTSVEDEVGQAARIALAVAAQLADKFARAREELARNAQRQSEQEQRLLQARFEGERDVAGARLMLVQRPEWWDRAGIAQVAGMHETAQQWKDFDPRAQAAAETIAREAKERYGVDVANLDVDPQAVRVALAQVELDRDQAARGERGTAATNFAQAIQAVQEADRLDARAADAQRGTDPGTGAGDNGDRTVDTSRLDEAARLELQAREYEMLASQGGTPEQTPAQLNELASDARSQAQLYREPEPTAQGLRERVPEGAVGVDQARVGAARSEGQLKYDSAARREATANELKAHDIPQATIDVRMRADIAQGRPASEAAARTNQVNVPKTSRGRGAGRSQDRPERSR